MTAPTNPPGFNTDTFSPPTDYRETSISDVVDAVAGPEPQAVLAYPFRGRPMVELQPYESEE